MKVLVPSDPVFNFPNKIGPAAWAGWVQERGLYFLGEKDSKYVDLVSMVDPFKDNPGEKLGSLVEAVWQGALAVRGARPLAAVAGGHQRRVSVAGQPDQFAESARRAAAGGAENRKYGGVGAVASGETTAIPFLQAEWRAATS